jgi:SprT protein
VSKESIANVLARYIPAPAVEICSRWIVQYNIHVRVTRSRASKFGDYRPLREINGHQITVNHDLNPYAFLITFVHEVAHLLAEVKSKKRISPHGKEWKSEFSRLLKYFLEQNIFPEDLVSALSSYTNNPAASSCSDHNLLRALRKHDKKETMENVHHLEDLPLHTLFRMQSSLSGLIFKKGSRIRTRFHCIEIKTQREYYVNPLAEVIIHEIPQDGQHFNVLGV